MAFLALCAAASLAEVNFSFRARGLDAWSVTALAAAAGLVHVAASPRKKSAQK